MPQMRNQMARCYALLQAQKLGTTVSVKPAEKSGAGASHFLTPVISTDCLPITKPSGEGSCAHQNMCSMQHLPVVNGQR